VQKELIMTGKKKLLW